MTHYVIGDLQGCFSEFKALLNKIDFNPGKDTLWLTGDIVNRGPHSLETLRYVRHHDSCMQTVLGNHDFHLLALSYGYGKIKRHDTITDILQATDCHLLLDWLRAQPLIIQKPPYLMVHAGLWPSWPVALASSLAKDVEYALQHKPADFFAHMYGNHPTTWSENLPTQDKLRFAVNVMTRMRALTHDGAMDFDYKSTLAQMPDTLLPWFDAPNRQNIDTTILFGHWSALGYHQQNNTICLDTGALWGGYLSALVLPSKQLVQVPSQTTLNWENVK